MVWKQHDMQDWSLVLTVRIEQTMRDHCRIGTGQRVIRACLEIEFIAQSKQSTRFDSNRSGKRFYDPAIFLDESQLIGEIVTPAADEACAEDAPGDGPSDPVVFEATDPGGPTAPGGNDLVLEGGAGDDTLIGGSGDDLIRGLGGDDSLDGGGGDDRLVGGSEDDRLLGGDGDDRLHGGAGDDQLRGGAGADHLFGLDGDDVLIGGLGRDELAGNRGADRFVLDEIAESPAQNADRLLDFRAYERDKIDVSGIDANSQSPEDEAFAFIAGDPFSGTAGELRFTESHGATYLYGDVNGDGEADFGLELLGVSALSVDDIVL